MFIHYIYGLFVYDNKHCSPKMLLILWAIDPVILFIESRIKLSDINFIPVLPYPPRDLTINAVRSTALVISWAPGFDGFSAILSYSLELQRQGAPQWRTIDGNITAHSLNYTITGLQPFTLYELRMRTYTMIGKSGYSNIVKARTLEDGKTSSSMIILLTLLVHCVDLSLKSLQTRQSIVVFSVRYWNQWYSFTKPV